MEKFQTVLKIINKRHEIKVLIAKRGGRRWGKRK